MQHEAYVDETKKVMVIRVIGDFSLDDVKECTNALAAKMGNRESFPMMVNLTQAPPRLSKEVRKYLEVENSGRKIKKQAFIVTNPAVRMIAKIMVSAQKNIGEVKFFKTEKQAVKWLHEEEQ